MRIDSRSFGLVVLALAAFGCGDAYTTQEAYAACEELIAGGPSGDSDELFAGCVACHEDCGSECALNGDSPAAFECPPAE